MKCTRFKTVHGKKRCAKFSGGKRRSRKGRRRLAGGLAGVHTIAGVKFHCTAYGRGPSRKLRCGTISSGGGPARNRPKGKYGVKGKYRKRGRYQKRVRLV